MSNMTAVMINGLSVVMLLFFAAMALFPLFLSERSTERTIEHANEDRVLHISPAPMIESRMPAAVRNQPVPFDSNARPDDDPSHREAA
jgi:hypothetical protein